ncbi:MAG: type II CRISPR-associated endonuclease Cas1 [Alphaproteobacteria bacterium]|nr:type II CRISPR-associated endonuclease Cas1 [Alphaproteobacteria bacterium]
MSKSTLFISSALSLRTENELIVLEDKVQGIKKTRPLQEVGVIILENYHIRLSLALLAKCLYYNVAVVICNDKHLPTGLLLNLDGNGLQSKIFSKQIEASQPLKKLLWQQTVQAKIMNQAQVLEFLEKPFKKLLDAVPKVKPGDADNREAYTAHIYWQTIFPESLAFLRDPDGIEPNNLLNYGYAIIRAIVARNLVGSGLLPTLGIFHKNQYNAYCLADDIMEPYRPMVDLLVAQLVNFAPMNYTLTPDIKKLLLNLPNAYVKIGREKNTLLTAIHKTTASLSLCFQGKKRKIVYPTMLKQHLLNYEL